MAPADLDQSSEVAPAKTCDPYTGQQARIGVMGLAGGEIAPGKLAHNLLNE